MVLSVNERTFSKEVLESALPVLVNFTAPWCGLCRVIHPLLVQFQTCWGEQVKIVSINADNNFKVVNKYRITALPTLILIEDGKIRQRLDTFRNRDDLTLALEKITANYTDVGKTPVGGRAADWECRSA